MIIYNILMMALSSAIMYIFAQLLYKRTKQKYARWYYLMLITSLLMLLVPIHLLKLPKLINITVPQNVSEAVYLTNQAAPADEFNPAVILFLIWFTFAASLTAFTLIKYIITRKMLIKISYENDNEDVFAIFGDVKAAMRIKKNILLRVSSEIDSPLLFGIIRPVILIPDREFTSSELEMVMAHELTHYKNHDLLTKLVTSFALCIHWFNPFAYMLSKSLNKACELCCDEAVLALLEPEDKKQYGKLIISVIESSVNRHMSFTTAMASPKKDIQNRLIKIVEYKKPSRIIKAICVMALISVSICSVTAFGIKISKEIIPEKVVEAIDNAVDTPPIQEILPIPTQAPEQAANVVQSTSAPENTIQPNKTAKATSSPLRTASPTTSTESPERSAEPNTSTVSPAPQTSAPTPEPTIKASEKSGVSKPENSNITALKETENNVDLNLSVNYSRNLNQEEVKNTKKEITIKTDEKNLEKGENVSVYVRPNSDGSYSVVHYEK